MLYVLEMRLGKRLETELANRGMSPTELCALVPDLNLGTLCATMDRDSGSSKFAPAISDALGLNLRWLLTGDGEKLAEVPKMAPPVANDDGLGHSAYTGKQVAGAESTASETEDDAMQVHRLRMVPVVGEVKGGDGGFFEELQYPVGHASEWIPTPIRDASAYALRVRGDSMHPRYRAGEFVLVMPAVEAKMHEDVVVRFKDGRKMIKVLNWLSTDEAQFLSINNGYAPMTVSRSEILSIQAVYGSIPASALQSQ